ncbi:hypothetical protein LCGC14_0777420 [marine sediment metagenome]|uniref:Uncharacterized protein n=1 Tax=marine sediment metagenome TaxID=412755 RepID=A0A0F9QGC4_9ZZZZ
MTVMDDFVEVRCRETGALLGVMDNASVPSEFLRGAPFTRLRVLEERPFPTTNLLGEIDAESTIKVERVIMVERFTFEWREPRLAPPYTADGNERLLLTFMMINEDDIAYLECVEGFRKVASWEDAHGHGRVLQ